MGKRQSRRRRSLRTRPRTANPILQRIRTRDALPSDYAHIRADLKRIAILGSVLILALVLLSFFIH
ncbi:MAG: hypothetical protein QF660_00885 [Anaerolineales bacterium]|jgi:hypothetical protein|nr:hypothetical protein [Anaerolineales bacterium]